MLKRSSEILQNLQNEKNQLSADINYLNVFKKHFEEKDGKVLDKNILHMNAGNVRGWVSVERCWIRLNAYALNSEGFTDYSQPDMRDCYVRIAENSFSYIPEGKKKEVLNAAAVNASIDEAIEEKRARIAEINATNESQIRETLKQYNNIVEQLKKFYDDNKFVMDHAGMSYVLRSPDIAIIDAEGFKPLSRSEARERLDADENEFTAETAGNISEYVKMKREAFNILKVGGWRENNICDLANQYGYIITGDRDTCTIYPLCVDNYNVMPCASVSISRGVAC